MQPHRLIARLQESAVKPVFEVRTEDNAVGRREHNVYNTKTGKKLGSYGDYDVAIRKAEDLEKKYRDKEMASPSSEEFIKHFREYLKDNPKEDSRFNTFWHNADLKGIMLVLQEFLEGYA